MNHPATRDPLGSRSPGCCYHHSPWNPHFCPPCRICQRPVLSLQPCILRHPVLFSHPPSIVECHAYEPPRRQRSFEAPRRRDVDITDGRSASYPHYHTHPPPGSSSAGYTLSKSPSVRLGSPGGSLGQRSPGARVPKSSGLPDQPHRWIGEETKRALPLHVYKYYLAHTKEYHRQNIKVIIIMSWSLAGLLTRLIIGQTQRGLINL
ncbi:hypothetical protein X777_08620 [Ooceraea biroi]|uniref:Uncharacterized protein n=1 Tax=Ooceraea biroi TaxID=2015173 RepID=A0A026X0W1_OOCBI|nr:hypothetical protein X777_08620 [Ooceraea biroi]